MKNKREVHMGFLIFLRRRIMEQKEFVDAAGSIVLSEIAETVPESRVKGTIKLTYSNGKRTVDLRRYSQGLSIKISDEGFIDLIFSEFYHDDITIRCTEYSKETCEKDMEDFGNIIRTLIRDFCGENINWHIAMDFLTGMKEGEDWRRVYEQARGGVHVK